MVGNKKFHHRQSENHNYTLYFWALCQSLFLECMEFCSSLILSLFIQWGQRLQPWLLMNRSNSLLHALRMYFLQDNSVGAIVPLFTDSVNMSRISYISLPMEIVHACLSFGEDAETRSCSLVTVKSRLSYILDIFFILPHSGVIAITMPCSSIILFLN